MSQDLPKNLYKKVEKTIIPVVIQTGSIMLEPDSKKVEAKAPQ